MVQQGVKAFGDPATNIQVAIDATRSRRAGQSARLWRLHGASDDARLERDAERSQVSACGDRRTNTLCSRVDSSGASPASRGGRWGRWRTSRWTRQRRLWASTARASSWMPRNRAASRRAGCACGSKSYVGRVYLAGDPGGEGRRCAFCGARARATRRRFHDRAARAGVQEVCVEVFRPGADTGRAAGNHGYRQRHACTWARFL